MTISEDIARLLDDNQLDEAIDLAKTHIKAKPGDREGRNLYVDLLVLAGDYEKADAQCGLAATFSPEDSVGFSLLRQHVRAMAARDAWFETGAVPDLPGGASELDELAIKAAIFQRGADVAASAQALAELEEKRGEVGIVLNGKIAPDIRDLDDRLPHALEALTNGGRYLWIDFSRIAALTIAPMSRPRDLAFRSAELTLTDGATASVLLPAIYHARTTDVALRLGRETDWDETNAPLVSGIGQRCLLVGDEMVPFHEISSLAAVEGQQERQIARG